MKLCELLEDTSYMDNQGLGAVPFNADIDYFGAVVLMKPSVFFKLCTPLDRSEATSVDYIKSHITAGKKIGPPWLTVKIPGAWSEGDLTEMASIQSHEGRNRMYAILELYGDVPVPVHLFPSGYRARHMTPEWLAAINRGIKAERSGAVVSGPLFTTK